MKLHDLYEPAPVPFRFDTPGWFILAGIILLIILIVVFVQLRKYIRNRYRREALQKLARLDSSGPCIMPLFVILKQTAMHAFGREKVGPLYGKEWLSFLEETGKDVHMSDYQEQVVQALYTGKEMEPDMQKHMLSNAENWIRTHAG
jgi:hypothetical protein